ncbi:MAG TPA: hypothetical protein VHU61_15020 [Solirubrobacteraceae bacterium]|jgi:hypothetical protein|nr:hypothetical protein [Solirubrobacteraceae bacterium]
MHRLDRDPKCTRVTAMAVTVVAVVCLIALPGAAGAQAAMIKKCPSAGSLKSGAGTALTIQSKAAGQDVLCHWNGTPTTTVTIVVGKREVTVMGNFPAKNVLAVAKQVS